MQTGDRKNSIGNGLVISIAIFLLILPNLHVSLLSNQAIIPRELFLYTASILFVFFLLSSLSIRYNTPFLLAGILCLWQFLSLTWSVDVAVGLEESFNFYYCILAAFALYQIDTERQKRFLFIAFVTGLSISALIGILQNFNLDPFPIFQASPPSSTFVNKNLAASATLLALPLSLSLLLTSKHQTHKLLYVVPSSLLFSYVLIAHSKGVWLAGIIIFILAVVLLHFMSKQSQLPISVSKDKVYLAIILAIGSLLFMLPGKRVTDLADQYDIWSDSATTRLGIYEDALPLISENPILGIGSGSFRRAFRAEPGGDYASQHALQDQYVTLLHNDHLQYLVELGFMGFLIWTSFLILMLKRAGDFLFDKEKEGLHKVMALALLLGVIAMLIHALFSFPVRIISTASLFWACVGLLLTYLPDFKAVTPTSITRQVKYPALLLHCALLAYTLYFTANRAVSSYHLQKAEDAIFDLGQCNIAKNHLSKAIDFAGLNIRLAHITTITYDACGHTSSMEMDALMDRILSYEPNQAKALLIKGKLSFLSNRYAEATEFFTHALRVNPASKSAKLGLAESLKKLKH